MYSDPVAALTGIQAGRLDADELGQVRRAAEAGVARHRADARLPDREFTVTSPPATMRMLRERSEARLKRASKGWRQVLRELGPA
jgi:hypothetical protein